ncbi:MAG: pentapeptide repeat-containing protein, partial [Cyanobacteriota bacterium]
ALKNAEAAQDKQITERFTKAVELLGHDNISIRLGGIYALKRIAEDSEKDHWTIMEVLTAFVREKAPLNKEEIQQDQSPKIPTDIQAALTVIGRRNVDKDSKDQWLYLRNTDIRGADLNGANLQRVDFWGANLEKAQFIKANLKETQLGKAKLEGAFFHQADLEKAKLCGANLQWAKLQDANLTGTDFTDAYLNCADFSRAKLEDAKLAHATLKGANLFKTNLKKTDFVGAYLEGTNLDEAENLEFEQIETAFGDSATVLPENVETPAQWTQAGGETDAIAPT